MNRFVKKYLLAALVVAFAGCGESPVGPPPVEPQDSVKPDRGSLRQGVDSVTVDTLEVEGTKQYSFVLFYTNGKMEDVTVKADWTSSSPSVASVTKGLVTALTAGEVTISASYLGFNPQLQLTVKPKPVLLVTVSLAGQDTLVKVFIRESVAFTNGRIVKFDSLGVKKVQVPENLLSSADSIFAFWHDLWGYNFQAVTDSAGADIVTDITDVGVKENACGFGSPTVINWETGFITQARIVLKPGYCSTGLAGTNNFAHELGHALGLLTHTPFVYGVAESFDIMAESPYTIRSTPVLDSVVAFYRASPAGAVVVEG